MVEYRDRMITFLRSNITDPANRTFSNGYHWILGGFPYKGFDSIGYPVIVVELPDVITRDNTAYGEIRNVIYRIHVYSKSLEDIKSIKAEIDDLFVVNAPDGLHIPKKLTETYTIIDIKDTAVHLVTLQYTFESFVSG